MLSLQGLALSSVQARLRKRARIKITATTNTSLIGQPKQNSTTNTKAYDVGRLVRVVAAPIRDRAVVVVAAPTPAAEDAIDVTIRMPTVSPLPNIARHIAHSVTTADDQLRNARPEL